MLISPPLHTSPPPHTYYASYGLLLPFIPSFLLLLYCFLSSSTFPIPLVIYSIPPSSFLLPYPWYLSLSSSPIICNHLTSPSLLPASCYFLLSSPFPPCPLLFPAFASCFFLSPPFPFSPFSSLLVCRPVLSLSIPPSVSPLLHPCPPLLSYFSSFIFPP